MPQPTAMKRSHFLHSLLVLPTALLLPGCNKSETGAGAAGAGKKLTIAFMP